ncbi:YrdB family protein [Streptomyces cavernae]|uniref:YrdB family protein n=1 Tax=Streptomyces cavernae TaxID=2259034 RepID=UPI000FEB5EDE|nr:YrdB family protein [Streptomyces cavernae]
MTIPAPLAWTAEGLAFLLELVALAVLAWWGFTWPGSRVASVVLGLGAPLLAAVVWGAFAAPRATYSLPLAGVLVVKAVVFGAAVLALVAIGHRNLALWFGGVVVLDTVVVTLLRAAE